MPAVCLCQACKSARDANHSAGHCRRRKIRCLLPADEGAVRCTNCIRLKKECLWATPDQQRGRPTNYRPASPSRLDSIASDLSSPWNLKRQVSGSFVEYREETTEYDENGRVRKKTSVTSMRSSSPGTPSRSPQHFGSALGQSSPGLFTSAMLADADSLISASVFQSR